MDPLRYTLLTDGPGDRCLRRIINWVLETIPEVSQRGFADQFADLRELREPPRAMSDKMRKAIALFPCDVLFVHRDAENEPRENRATEIREAAKAAGVAPHIPVIPVRMTEAWLLIEERAIRTAAGNPNGEAAFQLPDLHNLEEIPDPKGILQELLVVACEMSGRRRDKFKRELAWRIQRVGELISDFARLRALPAFATFEQETKRVVRERCVQS